MLTPRETCSSSSSITDFKASDEHDGLELSLSLGRHSSKNSCPSGVRREGDSGSLSDSKSEAVPNESKQERASGSRLTSAEIWQSIQIASPYGEMAQQVEPAPHVFPRRSLSLKFMDSQGKAIGRRPSLGCTGFMEKKISHMEREQQLQDTRELEREKEVEAQRRQEARKRRKSLIEEKQLRKAKRDAGNPNPLSRTSSNSAAMQHTACFQSGIGGGLRRELSLPVDIKWISVRSEVKNYQTKAGAEFQDGRKIKESRNDPADANKTWENPKIKEGKQHDLQGPTLESERHVEDHEASQTLSNKCVEALRAPTNASDPYAASSFPLIPTIPYSISIPGSTPTGLPLQMGFPIPSFMHVLQPQSMSFKDGSDPTGFKQLPPFQVPVSTGVPTSEACISWLSGSTSQAASNTVPSASWDKCNRFKGTDQSSCNEIHTRKTDLLFKSVQGKTSASICQNGCILPKPRKYCALLSDDSSKRALAKFGLTRTVSDPQVQLTLLHKLSDSNAQLSFIHGLYKSGSAHAGSFNSKAAACPEKPRALHVSHPATQDPVEESSPAPSPPYGKESHCMASKGSPSHYNTGDSTVSEVCSSESSGLSVALENSSMKIATNLQRDLADKVKSGETNPFSGLPRVSTTGPGPHGRTVTGFMYIFNKNHVKIVCTCHSTHMSPSEFLQHAGYTDLSNPERNILVNSFLVGSSQGERA